MAATPEYLALISQAKNRARKDAATNRKFFRKIKKEKPKGLTKAFRQFHDEVFAHHQCMHCANCCRTAQAVFEKPDVRRIAKHFVMTAKEFIKKYLKPHPDYEYLIKTLPCPFLADDNRCSIYEIRPAGCRTYPPAKLHLSDEQLDVLHDNLGICPAVSEIVEKVREKFDAGNQRSLH